MTLNDFTCVTQCLYQLHVFVPPKLDPQHFCKIGASSLLLFPKNVIAIGIDYVYSQGKLLNFVSNVCYYDLLIHSNHRQKDKPPTWVWHPKHNCILMQLFLCFNFGTHDITNYFATKQ